MCVSIPDAQLFSLPAKWGRTCALDHQQLTLDFFLISKSQTRHSFHPKTAYIKYTPHAQVKNLLCLQLKKYVRLVQCLFWFRTASLKLSSSHLAVCGTFERCGHAERLRTYLVHRKSPTNLLCSTKDQRAGAALAGDRI